MAEHLAADGTERNWRVVPEPVQNWRRLVNRTLAETLVLGPDGSPYLVRIVRNLPVRDSALGPFDNFVPPPVSLAALVATNVVTRGRTGWTVRVIKPRTRWLPRRVMLKERVRHGDDVADVAVGIAADVARGIKP